MIDNLYGLYGCIRNSLMSCKYSRHTDRQAHNLRSMVNPMAQHALTATMVATYSHAYSGADKMKEGDCTALWCP